MKHGSTLMTERTKYQSSQRHDWKPRWCQLS